MVEACIERAINHSTEATVPYAFALARKEDG